MTRAGGLSAREFYVHGNGDHTGAGNYTINGPAAELNYGVLPDTQLHLVVPMTTVGTEGAPTETGLGDMELGVKYRFVHETDRWPQIGVFPMAELPTGNPDRGLGNGKVWFCLPLWIQKSWGPWTTYGGGGVALNSAPGQRNYPSAAGCCSATSVRISPSAGELFAQGQDADDDRAYAALNFGGYYNFTEHFSLLFSAGHSVAGDNHFLWYFGLYWTWGPEKSSKP
jgi:Putative MetA-pathway of phenol degradation